MLCFGEWTNAYLHRFKQIVLSIDENSRDAPGEAETPKLGLGDVANLLSAANEIRLTTYVQEKNRDYRFWQNRI